MKTKFLLPMLAMIVAIGMSFTTVSLEMDSDYVHLGGNNWRAVSESTCTPGFNDCRVQDGVNGPIYFVYDEMDLGTLKSSDSDDPVIIDL